MVCVKRAIFAGTPRRLLTALGGVLAVMLACGKPASPTKPTTDDKYWTAGPLVRLGGTIKGALIPGESLQLSAIYDPRVAYGTGPKDRTADATWASSSPEILQVSTTGLATAKTPGSVIVTATVDGIAGTGVVSVAWSREQLRGNLDPSVAADLITYNQESVYNPRKGLIARWELPVPVFIDTSMGARRPCVVAALDMWKARTGISYTLLSGDETPRLKVSCVYITDNSASSRIETTNVDNRFWLTHIVFGNRWPDECSPQPSVNAALIGGPVFLAYVHEVGHSLGILGHPPGSVTGIPNASELSEREIRMIVELYKLPHGAHIEPDGTWAR